LCLAFVNVRTMADWSSDSPPTGAGPERASDGGRMQLFPLVVGVATSAWYAGLFIGVAYMTAHRDLYDYQSGAHMGSYPYQFWWVAVTSGAALIPLVAIPILVSFRKGFAPELLAGTAVLAGSFAVMYFATEFSSCGMGEIPAADTPVTLVQIALVLVVPFAVVFLASRRRGRISFAPGSTAMATAAVAGYLAMALFGSCSGLSSQVTRYQDAPIYTVMALVAAYPSAWLGAWFGDMLHTRSSSLVASSVTRSR